MLDFKIETAYFGYMRLNYILSFWRVRDKIICAKYTMFEIWAADCHIFCSCSRLTQYRPTMAELFKWATTLVWSDTRTRVTIVTPAEFKTAKKVWNLYWMQVDKMSWTVVKIEAEKSLKVQPKTGQSGEGVKIARWSASSVKSRPMPPQRTSWARNVVLLRDNLYQCRNEGMVPQRGSVCICINSGRRISWRASDIFCKSPSSQWLAHTWTRSQDMACFLSSYFKSSFGWNCTKKTFWLEI